MSRPAVPKTRFFAIVLLGVFVFVPGSAPSQSGGGDFLLISHGPYLQALTENAVTVVWATNKKCVSKVEYALAENFQTFPQFGGLIQTAQTSRDGLVEADVTYHKVRITGLQPGKTYRYRVVSKEIAQFAPYEVVFGAGVVGEISQFKTLDPQKSAFSFMVFQDNHENSPRLEKMLQSVSWKDVDLVFFNGDTVNHLETEPQIFNGFLDASVKIFAREIPFVYIRGNHDTRGALARSLRNYYDTPESRWYYAFDHGSVHFIVMDTGEDKPDTSPVYAGLADFDRYRREQAAWLKNHIETKAFREAAFRVAVFHIPVYGDRRGREGGAEPYTESELAKLWGPLLNEGGVDLLLSGHWHRFARKDPQEGKNSFPVLVGPADGMIRADVTAEKIVVSVTGADGKAVDNFSVLSKKKG